MVLKVLLAFSISTTLIIYGTALVLLGTLFIPIQQWYKEKHGGLSKDQQLIATSSLFLIAAVVTLPIQLVFFNDQRPPHADEAVSGIDFENLNPSNQQFGSINQVDEELLDNIMRRQMEAENERRALMGQPPLYRFDPPDLSPEERREIEEEQQQRREEHQRDLAHDKAVRDLAEDQFDHMELMGYYEPLPAGQTASSRPDDEQIVAAYEKFVQLKAEMQQAEDDLDAMRYEQRRLYEARPVDMDQVRAFDEKIKAAVHAVPKMNRPIFRQKIEVRKLLEQRLHAQLQGPTEGQTDLDQAPRSAALAVLRRAFDERVAEQRPGRLAELKRGREAERAERQAALRAQQERVAQARQAEREKRDAILKRMRDAEVYEPPFAESATDAQRGLDEQIISGNLAYQELVAERDRVAELKAEAREAFNAALRARPVDQDRVEAARKKLSESTQLSGPSPVDLMRRRVALEKLVRERIALEDAAP